MGKQRHQVVLQTLNLIWNTRGELLFIAFSEKKEKLAGWYSPPGGHVEMGEGIIESGKREVKEETGIEVGEMSLKGVVHVSNFFGKEIMLFVTESLVRSEVELVEGVEGTLEWVSPTRLGEVKIIEDLVMIIERAVEMKEGLFTARSRFDNEGRLVELVWE